MAAIVDLFSGSLAECIKHKHKPWIRIYSNKDGQFEILGCMISSFLKSCVSFKNSGYIMVELVSFLRDQSDFVIEACDPSIDDIREIFNYSVFIDGNCIKMDASVWCEKDKRLSIDFVGTPEEFFQKYKHDLYDKFYFKAK